MKIIPPLVLLLTVVIGCVQQGPPKEFKNKKPLVDESVVLGPKAWRSWRFVVDQKGARINGSYKTADGADHEIIFYVTDPQSKESLQKDNTGRYLYKSIDSKHRHMNAVLRELDPGEYYLLFQNESSTAEHDVSVRMYLEW